MLPTDETFLLSNLAHSVAEAQCGEIFWEDYYKYFISQFLFKLKHVHLKEMSHENTD